MQIWQVCGIFIWCHDVDELLNGKSIQSPSRSLSRWIWILIAIKLTRAHPLDSLRLHIFQFHFAFFSSPNPNLNLVPFQFSCFCLVFFIFNLQRWDEQTTTFSNALRRFFYQSSCECTENDRDSKYCTFILRTQHAHTHWHMYKECSHNVSLHITQLQEVKTLKLCLKLQNVISW